MILATLDNETFEIKKDAIFTKTENELSYFINLHDDYNFQFNFSGGKDSSAIVGLLLSLINDNRLTQSQKDRVVIYHSDTTIESPLFSTTTMKILNFFKACGLKVVIGRAKIQHRMFAQIFGYGKPIPNHAVRWCTDNLKIKLAEKFAKKMSEKTIIFTGEHIGESKKRDNKLSGCGSAECGMNEFKEKKTKQHEQMIHRPIVNWLDCQVWDYLKWLDYIDVINFYDDLAYIYDVANVKERNKSLRMGCVGCPVISKKNHLDTDKKGIPSHLSIRLVDIFDEMRNDNLRLRNPRRYKDGVDILGHDKNGGYGAITINARRHYWVKMKQLNIEMRAIGFDMICDREVEFIEDCLKRAQHPITYHKDPETIPMLYKEWQSRKPDWL